MKFSWGRKAKTSRGHYKTAKVKAEEQQAKTSEYLAKLYLKFLKEHPEYATQIAKERFALPESDSQDESDVRESPDLLSVLRQAKEAKELIRDEIGQPQRESTLAGIAAILREVPKLIGILPQGGAQVETRKAPQLSQPLQPPLEQLEAKSPQQTLIDFAQRFLSLEPAQAAAELYQHCTENGDIRSTLWRTITENGEIGVDDLVNMLPMLENYPQYGFLKPFTEQLTTSEGKLWLALLIDETKKLNQPEMSESVSKTGENEAKGAGNG